VCGATCVNGRLLRIHGGCACVRTHSCMSPSNSAHLTSNPFPIIFCIASGDTGESRWCAPPSLVEHATAATASSIACIFSSGRSPQDRKKIARGGKCLDHSVRGMDGQKLDESLQVLLFVQPPDPSSVAKLRSRSIPSSKFLGKNYDGAPQGQAGGEPALLRA
jgi:hypothetical protein